MYDGISGKLRQIFNCILTGRTALSRAFASCGPSNTRRPNMSEVEQDLEDDVLGLIDLGRVRNETGV